MNTQVATSSPMYRLDRALFWLRWLFLISVAMLAVLSTTGEAILGDATMPQDRLVIGLGVAVAANLLMGGLTLLPGLGQRLLGVISILFDAGSAALLFWAYDGSVAPLLILGTLAVFAAAVRFAWRGLAPALVLLAVLSLPLALAQASDSEDPALVNWGLSLGFLLVFGALGVVLKTGGWSTGNHGEVMDQREVEAARLRATRERANAIYEIANTLSATLDWRRVLEVAQDIGTMGLREIGPEARLISAALLFQGADNRLRVVSSRRLTRSDEHVAVPGRRGVLGLALKQAEPVFAGAAGRDPELRYFVAFQQAKSVLAIPLRSGFENYGVLVFGSDQPIAFTDDHVEMMTAIGTQATMALQNSVLYQNLLNEKERIVEVEEDARKKLARDLHDGPTQSVAAIAMRVNYIRRLLERQPQQAIEELWKVEELARRTTKEIRHMLFTLRPLVLENQGLIAALGQLAEKMHDTHDTEVTLKGQPQVENLLDTHAQGVLFYIIEEAVNNAHKHAEAEHIWVRLYQREAFVVVEIEDDGVGFDVGAVDAGYDQRGSLGMINMRERAELVEGTLRVQSAQGRGTKISILVPPHPVGGTGAADGGDGPAPPLHLQSQRAGGQTPSPDNAQPNASS